MDIRGISAKWSANNTSDTLHELTASVRSGQLLAVIGPVGSGKVIVDPSVSKSKNHVHANTGK